MKWSAEERQCLEGKVEHGGPQSPESGVDHIEEPRKGVEQSTKEPSDGNIMEIFQF